ncbi:large ribosomal subunit protein uL23m isoform X1 [Antennarius striatus]|uniref:large ribosomal subunit protein uL23m isoform X1 n=1 Tax=Antennarius striatus TaxID=241820 RepID=UPI0035B37381
MPVTRLIYPLYQFGGPQLRIFRPNWFLTLVRPGKEQPPDTVQFRIPMEMTKFDIKNYLEKIYNVPVGVVRTRIQHGSNKKRNHLNQRVKKPDYKVAYVQLWLSGRADVLEPDSAQPSAVRFPLQPDIFGVPKARHSPSQTFSQKKMKRQKRVPLRIFRRNSMKTSSRSRRWTPGEEGSLSGSDSEAAARHRNYETLFVLICVCL